MLPRHWYTVWKVRGTLRKFLNYYFNYILNLLKVQVVLFDIQQTNAALFINSLSSAPKNATFPFFNFLCSEITEFELNRSVLMRDIVNFSYVQLNQESMFVISKFSKWSLHTANSTNSPVPCQPYTCCLEYSNNVNKKQYDMNFVTLVPPALLALHLNTWYYMYYGLEDIISYKL